MLIFQYINLNYPETQSATHLPVHTTKRLSRKLTPPTQHTPTMSRRSTAICILICLLICFLSAMLVYYAVMDLSPPAPTSTARPPATLNLHAHGNNPSKPAQDQGPPLAPATAVPTVAASYVALVTRYIPDPRQRGKATEAADREAPLFTKQTLFAPAPTPFLVPSQPSDREERAGTAVVVDHEDSAVTLKTLVTRGNPASGSLSAVPSRIARLGAEEQTGMIEE